MGDDEVLSPAMTVVGMVNGMIGGLILILPVMVLNAGYILTFIVLLVTGLFSFYSCYLCVIHMGDQPDLDYAILRHFNGNRGIKIFYDLCVWSNLILIDMLYFQLIEIQWQGLVIHEEYPILNPLINALVLFGLVFLLKYFEFGASVMAYGIISIITYAVFLVWVSATSNQGNDKVEFNAFGTGAASLAAAMGQAYSIQSFFIPVLKKNPNPKKYVFYTMLAYIIGGGMYFYIAYMGSFGIWHRFMQGTDPNQITIEDYFSQGAWEVKIIEAIYLVHLYSVFPQFMIISKKRLFGVIGIEESRKGKVSVSEVIYFALAVCICLCIGILNVSITDIIDINGAVIGFFFIYFLPGILHIKCMYFSKGKKPLPKIELKIEEVPQTIEEEKFKNQKKRKESEIEIQNKVVELKIQEGLNQSLLDAKTEEIKETENIQYSVNKMQLSTKEIENSFYYCDCGKTEEGKKWQAVDLILIVVMVGMGAFIMVNGIMSVVKG